MKSSVHLWALALILIIVCVRATASEVSPSTNSIEPKVINVWPHDLALGETITVQVTNLNAWSNQSPENDPTKLVPLINGHKLDGLFPTETYLRSSILRFRLAITDANQDAWTDLLGKPKRFSYPVSFTVGMEGKDRFDTVFRFNSKDLHLTIMSRIWALISLVVVALTGIVLIQLSRKTDLIRDTTPHAPPPGKRRPYSLSRTQMAFWFFLVLTSYMGLWLITGSLETITPSILAIMGISAGTTLSSALIDADKHRSESARHDALQSEKQSLQASLAELDSQVTAAGELAPSASIKNERREQQQRLEAVESRLKELDLRHQERVSEGFLHDLLSDECGYSFHRFQIFAWTLVLGIIFVASVYEGLRMPEFNSTLLGLMGLSAGAYVSLKFPEK